MESLDAHRAQLLLLAAGWLLLAAAAAHVAIRRGEPRLQWLAWGLLGGPLALFAALGTGKICPHCREKVHRKARTCPHCQLPQTYKDLSADFRPHPEGLVARNSEDYLP